MAGFKERVLESNGFSGEFPSCREAEICPGPALTDFIGNPEQGVTRERVAGADRCAAGLRPAAGDHPIEAGEPGDTANIAFGIRAHAARRPAGADRPGRGRRSTRPGPATARPAGDEVAARRPAGAGRGVGDRPLAQPLLAHPRRPARGRAGAAGGLPLGVAGAGAAGADRARDRLVLAGARGDGHPAQPDVGGARGAGDRDRHRVQRDPLLPLPRGARRRAVGRRVAAPRLRPHRRRGARLGHDRDRRLRGADRQRHPDAARLRPRHRRRPRRRAARRDAGAARGARLGRAGLRAPRGAAAPGGRAAQAGEATSPARRSPAAARSGRRRGRAAATRSSSACSSWRSSSSPSSTRHHARLGHARPRRGDRRPAAAGVRRAGGGLASLEGDANIAQDDCETSELPCPADARAHARLPGRGAGRDPRLRPLRPAARDLVLVHPRRRLRGPAGRRQRGLRALPWTGELPLAQRARRPRHGARAGPRARLADAASATTTTARSRTSTGSAAARPSSSPIPAGSSRARASAS